MELPDDAPKPSKLPFIIGDVILLGVAAFLLYRLGPDASPAMVVAIIACAGLGVTCFLAPFLLSYARNQDQQVAERQAALEALTRTTASAIEQASIAANGLHEIAEITKRNLHSLDELPARIEAARQSAKNKENHQHATAVEALRNDVEQLREEQSGGQEATTQLLEKLVEQLTEIESRLNDRLGDLEARFDALRAAPPAAVAPPPPPPPAPPPPSPSVPPAEAPDTDVAAASAAAPTTTAPAAAAEPEPEAEAEKPKKKPRKAPPPPPEPSLFDPVDAAPDTSAAPRAEQRSDAESLPLDDEPPPEPSRSSDGLTRLTVTAYIGIGNRLFVRGDGPGLSRDEGTPLQFVSIGKWRWESDAATAPVKLTIWKNDQTECTALGEIELAPGAQLETSANF